MDRGYEYYPGIVPNTTFLYILLKTTLVVATLKAAKVMTSNSLKS